MTKPFWTPEKKADYLKLVKEYMQRERAKGNIKHWRKYSEEKNEN